MRIIRTAEYDFIVGTPAEIKPFYKSIERAGRKQRHAGFFPFTDSAHFNMSKEQYGIYIAPPDDSWPYGPTLFVISDLELIKEYSAGTSRYPWEDDEAVEAYWAEDPEDYAYN